MRYRHRPTRRSHSCSRWRPPSRVGGPPRSSPIPWRARSPAPRAPPSRLESARRDALRGGARRSEAPLTQTVEQIARRIAEEQQRRVLGAHEALFDGVAEQPPEPVPVAVDVQHAHRLGVKAQLRPRQDLERLIEGPETPGKRDEAVGERRHRGLALVHGADDPQLGEARVCELTRHERLRDDADHLATEGEYRVGEHSHEPDRTAAIDQAEPARGQLGAEASRGLRVGGAPALGRTAKDAHTLHSEAANSPETVPPKTPPTGPPRPTDQTHRTTDWT